MPSKKLVFIILMSKRRESCSLLYDGTVGCEPGASAARSYILRSRLENIFVNSLDFSAGSSGGGVLSSPHWWGLSTSHPWYEILSRSTFLHTAKGVLTAGWTHPPDPSDPFNRAWQFVELVPETAGPPEDEFGMATRLTTWKARSVHGSMRKPQRTRAVTILVVEPLVIPLPNNPKLRPQLSRSR